MWPQFVLSEFLLSNARTGDIRTPVRFSSLGKTCHAWRAFATRCAAVHTNRALILTWPFLFRHRTASSAANGVVKYVCHLGVT